MTKKEATKLQVGDYVTWREEMQFTTPQAISASTGEVIERGYNAIKVKWGDGVVGIYRHDDAPQMKHIHALA